MNLRGRVRDLWLLLLLWTVVPLSASAEQPIQALRLDYAYYSPASLVLKHFGWVEQAFKPDGVSVSWVLSAGSNRALEYLNSRSVDFGSTAGLAAVLSRANGNPVKAVYVSSRPEWVALVVARGSPIRSETPNRGIGQLKKAPFRGAHRKTGPARRRLRFQRRASPKSGRRAARRGRRPRQDSDAEADIVYFPHSPGKSPRGKKSRCRSAICLRKSSGPCRQICESPRN